MQRLRYDAFMEISNFFGILNIQIIFLLLYVHILQKYFDCSNMFSRTFINCIGIGKPRIQRTKQIEEYRKRVEELNPLTVDKRELRKCRECHQFYSTKMVIENQWYGLFLLLKIRN